MGKDTQKNASRKARILCVWELGGNLGHLTNLKLFVDEALARGHQVSLAVRELDHIDKVFSDYDLPLYQTPRIRPLSTEDESPMLSYVDMLARQVFSNSTQLNTLFSAWESLFGAVNPDLVIYDHSPTALIASSEQPWQKWVVGSGFLVPRSTGDYLGVFPDVPKNSKNDELLEAVEGEVLGLINGVLNERSLKPWESLSELFDQCERNLLLTIPELDHFGVREDGCYLGAKHGNGGSEPKWPKRPEATNSVRVFIYVNDFLGLDALLSELVRQRARVIVYCKDLPTSIRQKHEREIMIVEKPVNIELVCQQSDYVICNGGHGVLAQAYVAGVPLLLIPLQREQYLLSIRVKQQRRALLVSPGVVQYQKVLKALWELKKDPVKQLAPVAGGRLVKQRMTQIFDDEGF